LLPYLKALSDETRLRLVNVLHLYELNVTELTAVLDQGQSRVSRHLKILADSGLLTFRRDGLWVFYSAIRQGPGTELIGLLLNLGGDDPTLKQDLDRAARVLAERAWARQVFFKNIAGQWESLRREVLGGFDLNAEVLSRLPEGGAVVDLGCGTGDVLQAMLPRVSQAIGVDSSPQMLELAQRRFQKERTPVSLRIGELEHLPLSDGEVDFAVASLVLHHLSDPLAGLKEARRVLRPGGALVVIDFEKHSSEVMRSRYGDHWLGFSPERLAGWLEEAGFRVVESARFQVNQGLNVQLFLAEKNPKSAGGKP